MAKPQPSGVFDFFEERLDAPLCSQGISQLYYGGREMTFGRRKPTALLVAMLVLLVAPAGAQTNYEDDHDAIVGGGPWHFHLVPCAQGVVTGVMPRVGKENQRVYTDQDFKSAGVHVEMKLPPHTHFIPNANMEYVSVTHYQEDRENNVMQAERVGDKVQVCLMSFPIPLYEASIKGYRCNPDEDQRGWYFRVYDYRQRKAYFGPNLQHGCGGA
jgi:hypothetical protein